MLTDKLNCILDAYQKVKQQFRYNDAVSQITYKFKILIKKECPVQL